jgi:hypothetical protein
MKSTAGAVPSGLATLARSQTTGSEALRRALRTQGLQVS